MHIGHYISGTAHIGVIFWALFGGMFRPEPLPIEMARVSVISQQEFDAMTAAYQPPDVVETPPALVQDTTQDTVPEPVEQPAAPSTSVIPPARPDPVVDPTPPTPPQEAADDLPVTAPTPAPRPIDRVAPEAVAPPPDDVTPDDVIQESVTLSDEAQSETDQKVEQEATAPEAATTEIITEAKAPPSGAPDRSPRPRARPEQPTPDPVQPPRDESVDTASVQSALTEALSQAAPTPSGPPLTSGETDAFRVSVQQCWVVDVGSEAANVTVTVAMAMEKDGKVDSGSIRLIASRGGSESATDTAFQAARRAILRCQKDGYSLPVDKYDQWRDIEITFNPEDMRTR